MTPAMITPVVIDCDPGIDDMIALLLACASPELDLRAVTTVGGNLGIETTTRNARAVLALAGRPDVPVAAGATRPLVRQAPRHAERAHGEEGLGGITLPAAGGAPDPRHAVDLIAETVTGSSEPITLIAVGPLTNVALFYARYPELANRLAQLVLMGGSIGAGNVTPAAEFNIWFDPEAAYRVLTDPPVPTTMIGLDVTYASALTPDDLARLARFGGTGELATQALRHYLHGYAELLGREAVPVHDAVAVVAVIRPDLLDVRSARIEVDAGPGPSRGSTLVDLHDAAPTARVAVGADVAAVVNLIIDRVAHGSADAGATSADAAGTTADTATKGDASDPG